MESGSGLGNRLAKTYLEELYRPWFTEVDHPVVSDTGDPHPMTPADMLPACDSPAARSKLFHTTVSYLIRGESFDPLPGVIDPCLVFEGLSFAGGGETSLFLQIGQICRQSAQRLAYGHPH